MDILAAHLTAILERSQRFYIAASSNITISDIFRGRHMKPIKLHPHSARMGLAGVLCYIFLIHSIIVSVIVAVILAELFMAYVLYKPDREIDLDFNDRLLEAGFGKFWAFLPVRDISGSWKVFRPMYFAVLDYPSQSVMGLLFSTSPLDLQVVKSCSCAEKRNVLIVTNADNVVDTSPFCYRHLKLLPKG